MKESKLYIKFIANNLLLLTSLAAIFALLGFYYQAIKPLKYKSEILLEISSNTTQTTAKELSDSLEIADHLVTLIRTPNLQSQLGLDKSLQISSVRFSPIGFKISVISTHPSEAQLKLIFQDVKTSFDSKNLYGKYSLRQVGDISNSSIKENIYLAILIGFFSGLGLGFLIALVRVYLQKY